MDAGSMLLAMLFCAAAVGVSISAYLGRADRPYGATTGWWFAAIVLAFLGTSVLAQPLALAIILLGPIWLISRYVRGGRQVKQERDELRQLRIATGSSAQEAQRAHHRPPRGIVAIVSIYSLAAFIWFVLVVSALAAAGHDPFTEPAFGLPATGDGDGASAELVWWLWVMGLICAAGGVHSCINEARRVWT